MSSKYTSFLIAPERTGVDLGIDPWLTPPDAFQQIFDAYEFLGVITKREGYSWFDQVPHAVQGSVGFEYQNVLDITNGPNSTVTTHGPHGLPDGSVIRLTDVLGLIAPAVLPSANINRTRWTITVTGPTTFTINNDFAYGGVYTAGTGTLSFFPSLLGGGTAVLAPITAIAIWVDQANNPHLMVLDDKRASIYDSSAINQCLVPIGTVDQFTKPGRFFFWWENYLGYIFFTNNFDPIFYWNTDPAITPPAAPAPTTLAGGLAPFKPQITANILDVVNRCLMIKVVGNRLCLFNTNETITGTGTFDYPVRIRWCNALTNAVATVIAAPYFNVWDEIVPGQGGGHLDAVGSQYIITLGQIQTNVLFASQGQLFSSWYEMRTVNDPKIPFVIVKISTSRNVQSTFGTVVLDRQLTSVGDTGLITTDGNTVARYDQRIPQFAVDNIDQEKFQECFGVRNDLLWQTWLLYPNSIDDNGNVQNTNQVLVYNYQDQCWSIYRPAYPATLNGVAITANITCLGLTFFPDIDPTWISYGSELPDLAWIDFDEETWTSSPQKSSNVLVGGDELGNIWYMDSGGGDAADNTIYLAPLDDGEEIELNLITRQWYPFASEGVAAQFGYVDMLIDGDPISTGTIKFNVDNEINNYLSTNFTCIPFENIIIAAITNITNANPGEVTSPNHGLISGQTVYIFAVNGMVEVNNNFFTITVVDADHFTIGVDTSAFGVYTMNGGVARQQITQTAFWVRVWTGQTGVFHTMQILSGGVDQSFRLHAMSVSFKKSGRVYKG